MQELIQNFPTVTVTLSTGLLAKVLGGVGVLLWGFGTRNEVNGIRKLTEGSSYEADSHFRRYGVQQFLGVVLIYVALFYFGQ